MNNRIKFRWGAHDKGHLCHQVRCKEPAVANRLCAEHLAWWTTQCHCQPPLPDYEKAGITVQAEMLAERRKADQEFKRIAGLPMRQLADANAMHEEAEGSAEYVELLRKSKHDSLKPLIDHARVIKKAHDQAIARYKDCESLAKLRLQEFDYLHDFDVKDRPTPRHSGIPEARKSLRPGVVRRAAK